MYYSACIPALFRGMPIHEALPLVKEAGLGHYEFWMWKGQDIDAIVSAQDALGLTPVAMCTTEFALTDPSRREAFAAGIAETIPVCHALGCKKIITQVGAELSHLTRQEQHASIVAGLKAVVPLLEEADLTLIFEPLNTRVDHKGYYLWSCEEAFAIQKEVGSDRVKVLLDLYHQAVMDDLNLPLILENLDKIGHFHMAGCPGRHEPHFDSNLDYAPILRSIREAGYSEAVGLEYFPVKPALEGLKTLIPQLLTF